MPMVRTVAALMAASLASISPALAGSGGGGVSPDNAYDSAGVYADNAQQTCQSARGCEVSLSAVPAGKVLTILDTSCYITVGGTGTVYLLDLTASARPVYLKPVLVASVSGTKYYTSNDETYAPYPAGAKPSVYVDTSAVEPTMTIRCTVDGSLH